MAETNPKDTKTVFLYLGIALVVLVLLGFFSTGKLPFFTKTDQVQTLKTATVAFGDKQITAEVADTDQKRQTGLSSYETLEEGKGMLFVFDKQDIQPAFWMKDMKFGIDIIWIDNNKIVQVDEAKPEPGVADANLTLYKPTVPVDLVLEVRQGYVFENRIEVGSDVSVSGL